MVLRSKENLWGAWAFLVGVVLALAVGVLSAGLGSLNAIILAVLVILGLVVGFGFAGVSGKDAHTFLMASISLVIVSFAGSQSIERITSIEFLSISIGNIITTTLSALLMMLIPATIVVSIKSLFSISTNK